MFPTWRMSYTPVNKLQFIQDTSRRVWDVQSIQRRIAVWQVTSVIGAISMHTSMQTRLVVNRRPRHLIGLMGREGRPDAKRQAAFPGVDQSIEQLTALEGVGEVGDASGAGIRSAGVFVITGLCAGGHVVDDGNDALCRWIARTLFGRLEFDFHCPRWAFALGIPYGTPTDGAIGRLVQAIGDAAAMESMRASL